MLVQDSHNIGIAVDTQEGLTSNIFKYVVCISKF